MGIGVQGGASLGEIMVEGADVEKAWEDRRWRGGKSKLRRKRAEMIERKRKMVGRAVDEG